MSDKATAAVITSLKAHNSIVPPFAVADLDGLDLAEAIRKFVLAHFKELGVSDPSSLAIDWLWSIDLNENNLAYQLKLSPSSQPFDAIRNCSKKVVDSWRRLFGYVCSRQCLLFGSDLAGQSLSVKLTDEHLIEARSGEVFLRRREKGDRVNERLWCQIVLMKNENHELNFKKSVSRAPAPPPQIRGGGWSPMHDDLSREEKKKLFAEANPQKPVGDNGQADNPTGRKINKAVGKIWNGRIPDTMTLSEFEKRVGNWITQNLSGQTVPGRSSFKRFWKSVRATPAS
jgi:hypothetical protein